MTPDEYSECSVCGDTFDNTDYVDVFTRPDGATICERCVPLELETVTCSECGRVGSEAAACWLMATPVCPECFVGPAA